MSSDKAKLSFFKSYLTGYATHLISHLTLEEANYEVTMKLLTEEFLDMPLIVDEIFKQLLDASPKYDTNFINVKQFLSETCADLSELRTSYNLDFFEEETPGFRIISHIVFAKLPSILQRKLVHKFSTNYPTIKDIFDNYNENIKTLIKTSRKNNFNPERNNAYPSKKKNNHPKAESKNVSALENFTTRADSIPNCCKLCKKKGHPMSHCSTYASAQTRQARCRELNICTLCTSSRHKMKNCLGKRNRLPFKCLLCNLRNHVTPLCDTAEKKKNSALSINVCNSSRTLNQPFILPMVSLSVSKGQQKYNVSCLLDTGSQRSYFSKGVVEKLKCKKDSFTPGVYEVSTFLGTRKKRLEEVVLGIQVDKDRTFHLPVLVDNDFDINLNIDHFGEVKKNLNNLKHKLDFTDNGSDQVCIHGLIGVDIIQFIDMKMIKCMNGIAWEFSTGIAPSSNSHYFLH